MASFITRLQPPYNNFHRSPPHATTVFIFKISFFPFMLLKFFMRSTQLTNLHFAEIQQFNDSMTCTWIVKWFYHRNLRPAILLNSPARVVEEHAVERPVRALVANRYGMRCVAAGRRTRHLLHGCVALSRRQTTHNRAEPVRERLLGFHLVPIPGVPVDTLERVTPKWEAQR